MKQIGTLLLILVTFQSCQKQHSGFNSDLLAHINDDAIKRLENRHMELGLHQFIEPVIEKLKDCSAKRSRAINEGAWAEYASSLKSAMQEVEAIWSFDSEAFFNEMSTKFDEKNPGTLLGIEAYLISKAEESFFNYFYQSDVLYPFINVPEKVYSGKKVKGEIHLKAHSSTLKNLVEFEIIDKATNSLERQYKISSTSRGELEFDYLGVKRGTKIIQGQLMIFKNGEYLKLPFKKEMIVD